MCGICGIIGNPGTIGTEAIDVVQRMKQKIIHRGPDGEGLFHGRRAVFGHRRLAIIDLDHGQQPMVSEDNRYVLVFNGEIYNYLELRQQLIQRGINVNTYSDTEVLFRLLINRWQETLQQLNGIFAFVFYDTHSEEWLMAVDPCAVKPLYYASVGGRQLVFASEIKSLLVHPEVKARVNLPALQQYLTFQYCLNGDTLFEGIHKVEPGFFLRGRGAQIEKMVRYWDVNYTVDEHHTEQYFNDRLHALLTDSARLQIRSDVPLGTYLSGGLDSSTVSTLAAECLGVKVPVFNGRFSESPAYDESHYARIVAAQIGAVMYQTTPSADDFVKHVSGIIYALDEPVAGPGVFPQYMVSRLAADHVKVVLGGQGGDEIFGGYARYLIGYLEQALKGAVYESQEEGKHLVSLESIIPNLPLLKQYTPLMKNFWSDGLFEPMDARYFRLIDRSPNLEKILTDDAWASLDRETLFERFQQLFNHPDTKSYINKMTHFDFKTLLPALLHIEDRVSMAVSLESRVPLLDTRIVELVASAPPAMKFKGGETKALLRRVVANLLPQQVLNRKDKMGFPVPLKQWMQGSVAREFVNDTLLSQASRERGLFKAEALKGLTDQQGVGGRQLWGALSLELWHTIYIDHAA